MSDAPLKIDEIRSRFLNPDGSLKLQRWAYLPHPHTMVAVPEPVVPMYGTSARATPLVSSGFLGADLIQIPAGEGFEPHTHIGDHLLFGLIGKGTITYEGKIYVVEPGEVYMVEGSKPHAVGAIDDHVLISIGAPHRSADAADRMALTEYAAVAAELGDLFCLACQRTVRVGDPSCAHAPHPRIRRRPVALAASWDEWEQDKLAEWFGVQRSDLDRVVELEAFGDREAAAVAALRGRVVIAYGKVAGALLIDLMPDRDYKVDVLEDEGVKPTLVITVRWAAEWRVQRAVLRLAHTLAAAGPLEKDWSHRDVLEVGFAIERALI